MKLRGAASAAIRSLVAAVLLAAASSVSAQTEEIVYVTKGHGLTPEAALDQALIEVLRQSTGVQIDARVGTETTFENRQSGSSSGETHEVVAAEKLHAEVRAKVAGAVKSYEILRESPSSSGYEVEVRAVVARYHAPGLDAESRRRLAVLPFTCRARTVNFFGAMSAAEIAQTLHQAVLTQFVQSRRFAVLDRDSWNLIAAEKELIASDATPIEEKAKLGRTLGADYLLVGEILAAAGGTDSHTGTMTGITTHTTSSRLAVAFRVVVPATGQIKFADSMELTAGGSLPSRMAALNEFSKRMVGVAEDRIFPLQVIALAPNGEIVLNQGGSTLSNGDQLVLMEQGEAMTDPYTKEELGRVETPIGRIEITHSDGKLSYARPVGKTAAQPKVGQLARRDLSLYAAGKREHAPQPAPRTGGVKLPFDR